VRDAFGERGLGDVQIQDSLAAEMPLGYRATVKLSFAKSQGVIKLGLYRRGTHQVVDLKNCPLHHPLINRIVSAVRAEANHQRISVYDPKCDQGLLRYLLVRVSPALNKAMVTFVVTEKDIRRLMPMAKWLQRKIPEVVSIHQNINDTEGNAIIGRETSRLLGVSDLFDVVGDIRVRTSPTAFVQVNHEQAARIYRMVSEWSELSAEQLAVDLYCGIGGISLHLARRAKQVVCIEMQPDAVRNAIDNAKFNDLHNCRFIAGNAVELLDTLELPPQTVAVVNPPRKGCEHQLLKAIAHSPITRLIYVSCCPETLARDVATLCKQGLVLQRVQPVDMFPQTPHVETVALLTR
jgi:23S rRNA (uracil1939-C5)-methyltransferase